LPTITAANFKTFARIYHTADDTFITNILLPAAIAAFERATGVSAQALARTALVSEEGETPFYPYPQPIQAPAYTEDGSATIYTPDQHWEGERQVLIIPEDAARPVTVYWDTLEQAEAVLPVFQLATRLYADRGDSTGNIEGKAQQMMVSLMHERPVV
jgi:hypothetical protein